MQHKGNAPCAQSKAPTVKKAKPPKNLLECAEVLVSIHQTPDRFIKFLSDAMEWVGSLSSKKPDAFAQDTFLGVGFDFYGIGILIRDVACRWVESPENHLEAMAEGMQGNLFFKDGGLKALIPQIYEAFVYEVHEGISDEYLSDSMKGISSLRQVAHIINEFEISQEHLNTNL